MAERTPVIILQHSVTNIIKLAESLIFHKETESGSPPPPKKKGNQNVSKAGQKTQHFLISLGGEDTFVLKNRLKSVKELKSAY